MEGRLRAHHSAVRWRLGITVVIMVVLITDSCCCYCYLSSMLTDPRAG